MKVIKSLYCDFKACVNRNSELSELIAITRGVLEGESLSPLLFSLSVNDIVDDLYTDANDNTVLDLLNLTLIMYADDIVVFADTPGKLQQILDSLHAYLSLSVNVDKTKVVVFRNGGTVQENWYYNASLLCKEDSFNYLGLMFVYNRKFRTEHRTLAE